MTNFIKVKKIESLTEKLKNEEQWIEEALENYDEEDIIGGYIIIEKNGKMVEKKNIEGIEINIQLVQYLSQSSHPSLYKESVEAIEDDEGIWIDEDKLF